MTSLLFRSLEKPMQLIPAIDLRQGKVVRLVQGDDGRRTRYGVDPFDVLRQYAEAGVVLVHVVDLDAALGEAVQRELITGLVESGQSGCGRPGSGRVGRPGGAPTVYFGHPGTGIELGGGLGDRDAVAWALGAGCERVVMGSIVARDFDAFAGIVRDFPGRVVPAIEVAAGKLRVAGWKEEAEVTVSEVCRRLRGLACPAVLVTDVERDGTLAGPNLDLARQVAVGTGIPALLSGGVRSLDDLRAAARAEEIAGAIVGKALYEGLFTVEEAMAACEGRPPPHPNPLPQGGEGTRGRPR